jgi:hypothetical protein
MLNDVHKPSPIHSSDDVRYRTELGRPARVSPSEAAGTRGGDPSRDSSAQSPQLPGRALDAQPRSFTQVVREFHQLLLLVRAQDLTTTDRATLRSLFRDLVLLGRAATAAEQTPVP